MQKFSLFGWYGSFLSMNHTEWNSKNKVKKQTDWLCFYFNNDNKLQLEKRWNGENGELLVQWETLFQDNNTESDGGRPSVLSALASVWGTHKVKTKTS